MTDDESPSETARRLQRQIVRLRRDAAAWRSAGDRETAAHLAVMMDALRHIVDDAAQSGALLAQASRSRTRRT